MGEPSQGSSDDEETMGASQIAEPKQNCDDEETNKKRSNPEGPGSDADKKKRVAAEGVAGSNALRPIGASQESMNDSDIEVTFQVAGDIALMIETSMLWVPPRFPGQPQLLRKERYRDAPDGARPDSHVARRPQILSVCKFRAAARLDREVRRARRDMPICRPPQA